MNYPTKLANLIVLVIDNKWKQIRCRLLNRICGVLRNVQRMTDTTTQTLALALALTLLDTQSEKEMERK